MTSSVTVFPPDAADAQMRREVQFENHTLQIQRCPVDTVSRTEESCKSSAAKSTTAARDECHVVDTIKVSGLEEDESQDLIQLFFENKRRSGGGDISNVYPLEDGEVIISFKNPAGQW